MSSTVTFWSSCTCGTLSVLPAMKILMPCITRLCLRLCMNADGVMPATPPGKTAVPSTRGGGCEPPHSDLISPASGMLSVFMRSTTSSRPRCQVVITVNNRPPASTGNQPPSNTLLTLLETNAASTSTNGPMTTKVESAFHFHSECVMKYISIVVSSIVEATAIP